MTAYVSPDGNGIYRYMGQPGKWQRIWNYASSIYAAPGYLYATDKKGDIYKYNGNPFSWTKIGGPGKMFTATDTGELFAISPDGKGVYKYLGKPGSWKKIGNGSKSIFAQKGQLYSLRQDASLWSYKGQRLSENTNFIIITNDESLSNAVKDYAAYQQLHGVSVSVVTLDVVLRSSNGFDEAEKIRNYLIKANQSGLLQYLLLVGDVDRIPTKVFFANNGVVKGNRAKQNAYTTDFYYANLHTKNWDLDKDGLWGEIKDDGHVGENIRHDVVVSRIPFNDAITVKQVMKNMIDFHKKSGSQWQKRVVLAHGFVNDTDDLAGYAEKIDKDILQPNKFSVDKLYVNTVQSNAGKTKSSYFDLRVITESGV